MIVPYSEKYKDWSANLIQERWGSTLIVSRSQVHDAINLEGFVFLDNDEPVGLITYNTRERECEIVTVDTTIQGKGYAKELVENVLRVAENRKHRRVWLVTTNDNTDALCFYQKIGFHLTAIYPNEILKSKELKPEIPDFGSNGIPIRDEIELEKIIDRSTLRTPQLDVDSAK